MLGVGGLAMIVGCAGCGGTNSSPPITPAPPRGIVTGFAAPCTGIAISNYHYNRLPMLVTLTRANKVVAKQAGHGTVNFRFSVSPGTYVLSSTRDFPSKTIVVLNGQTTKVDLPDVCA